MIPEFLIVPYQIYAHEKLRPADKIVYAVVYWYEKMKDGKCIASNESIARVANIEPRTVGLALERLEQYKFIKREFDGTDGNHRKEIKTLVYMAQKESDHKPTKDEKQERPVEINRQFFNKDKNEIKTKIRNEVIRKYAIDEANAKEVIKQFWLYWTEPNKSGSKVRWELQATFDLNRRLATWISRSNKGKRAGAGAEI
jgi:DNA-binding MarR family transcriptional regulator